MSGIRRIGILGAVCPLAAGLVAPGGSERTEGVRDAAAGPGWRTASLVSGPAQASEPAQGTVYVPAYSSLRMGNGRPTVLFAVTLSIHNTSETRSLVLHRIDYFGTSGDLIQHHLQAPLTLRPLQTTEAFIPVQDDRGGTGANFIVEWRSDGPITEPVIEAVMVGEVGTQGYAFVTQGRPLRPHRP